MKKTLLLPLIGALSIFSACNKQSDADRQAEIDRQVQQKLDAEHAAQQREDLARREGELNAREQALADKQNTPNESNETQDRQVAPEREPGGDYGLFYSKLEAHGDWLETAQYGYVFHPRDSQNPSWRPYTNGRWVYTDAGWTWVSQEPFGWATYHYGRWIRLSNVGWVWIPGNEWAPAWVSWRKSDNYVGWAPLPPEAQFDRRSGIHNWADSYYDIGPESYSFVETREFGTPQLARAIVRTQQNVTIVNQTTNVTNITYNNTTIVNQGPSFDEINTRSAQPVQRLKLERDVNVNINAGEPRSVVRADAVVFAAPVIGPARKGERPRAAKKAAGSLVVERGWEEIYDRQAVDKARAKIRAEATPPPNAPAKTFVTPTQTTAPASTPAERSTSPSAPTPNESPTVVAPKATPFQMRSAPPAPHTTSAPSMTPEATQSPTPPRPRFISGHKPPQGAVPSPSATASPETSATPNSLGVSPSPAAAENVEQRRNAPRDQRRNGPQKKEDRQERMRERRQGQRGLTSPGAAPSATATPTPTGM